MKLLVLNNDSVVCEFCYDEIDEIEREFQDNLIMESTTKGTCKWCGNVSDEMNAEIEAKYAEIQAAAEKEDKIPELNIDDDWPLVYRLVGEAERDGFYDDESDFYDDEPDFDDE